MKMDLWGDGLAIESSRIITPPRRGNAAKQVKYEIMDTAKHASIG